MKTDASIIQYLNQVLGLELIAINQYFLHARMFRNWGFGRLNDSEYQASIRAMKQADRLIERILFLEGLPNLQELGRIRIGENTPEMLGCDLQLAGTLVALLREATRHCEQQSDYVSRELLTGLLEQEEEHIDWLETQQALIEATGLENYLQSSL